ncbi:hypothetical protein PV08_00572 [Exophiala spinifera]|uniref:Uncharacterized protein n=1 Tax=Exophiala spinifera TaxID=91928 RepID=A0A0D2A5H3_9EURO|nr:uncharacterized protein PV08_00572 [Exophiala spinifera]KIW19997.1 hypothetical protein PV08_00572 [Exophiala spinifera]
MARITLMMNPEQMFYNPYTNLVRLAIQDVAACHALLANASAIWEGVFGRSMQYQSTAHKLMAIQIIGNRLKEGGKPSEPTIVAVILLWAFEVYAMTI